jgi:hypothetical protein
LPLEREHRTGAVEAGGTATPASVVFTAAN